MRRRRSGGIVAGAWLALSAGAGAAGAPPPIIDMHLHAEPADSQGPPPLVVCAPYEEMPGRDPAMSPAAFAAATFKTARCPHPIWSAPDDDALRLRSLALLRRYNIVAVTSGPADLVARWHAAAPDRIVPGLEFGAADAPTPARLRALHAAGQLAVVGEIGAQYDGAAPDDPRLEPVWATAEALDLPVGIHMGPGPPGAVYLGIAGYRTGLSDPLLLEPVLVRHPRLRVYVMHAGWPLVDRMIALLYAHPQVYVDTGVIDFTQPRREFHRYLRRLVEAGYARRILFGSDQMVWPDAIPAAIAAITSARFLTRAQRRDILHDNAARFLRLPGAPP